MKTTLKAKGTGTPRPKKKKNTAEEVDEKNKGKKKATFAEAVQEKPAQKVDYKKCVVGFAIRVDKGNNTKGGFDKKLMEGLNFMWTYIDSHAAFFPIGKDQTEKPIREKAEMPKYQVTMKNYFSIPNPRAYDNVNQEGGRVIKGSAVMCFSQDPETCLYDASGDLRMMGCAIYYKKCQEVDTVATQVLVGVPNVIEEDIIKQVMDKELKELEEKVHTH
jgi:hypothetical protein